MHTTMRHHLDPKTRYSIFSRWSTSTHDTMVSTKRCTARLILLVTRVMQQQASCYAPYVLWRTWHTRRKSFHTSVEQSQEFLRSRKLSRCLWVCWNTETNPYKLFSYCMIVFNSNVFFYRLIWPYLQCFKALNNKHIYHWECRCWCDPPGRQTSTL